jgi:hypothetical protein
MLSRSVGALNTFKFATFGRRSASNQIRDHKGVVVSRAQIDGKVYTRIRDMNPSRQRVYLHEADPLNPRSSAIDAKEGDSIEFDLDDNLRPIEVLTKSSPTGGIMAADLLNEKIPPPILADDLAPLSDTVVHILASPDEVTRASLETVEAYLDRTIHSRPKGKGVSVQKDNYRRDDADLMTTDEKEKKKGDTAERYPALRWILEEVLAPDEDDAREEALGFDTEKLEAKCKEAGLTENASNFLIEAVIRNRQLSLLDFENVKPPRDPSIKRLKRFAELIERESKDTVIEDDLFDDDREEFGESLLARDETVNIKEDPMEDLIRSSSSATSSDPLAVFKSLEKKSKK